MSNLLDDIMGENDPYTRLQRLERIAVGNGKAIADLLENYAMLNHAVADLREQMAHYIENQNELVSLVALSHNERIKDLEEKQKETRG